LSCILLKIIRIRSKYITKRPVWGPEKYLTSVELELIKNIKWIQAYFWIQTCWVGVHSLTQTHEVVRHITPNKLGMSCLCWVCWDMPNWACALHAQYDLEFLVRTHVLYYKNLKFSILTWKTHIYSYLLKIYINYFLLNNKI
jgi:hypothetical protein